MWKKDFDCTTADPSRFACDVEFAGLVAKAMLRVPLSFNRTSAMDSKMDSILARMLIPLDATSGMLDRV